MPSIEISLEEVLAHNGALKKGPKGLVGVFGKFGEKSRRTKSTETAPKWEVQAE